MLRTLAAAVALVLLVGAATNVLTGALRERPRRLRENQIAQLKASSVGVVMPVMVMTDSMPDREMQLFVDQVFGALKAARLVENGGPVYGFRGVAPPGLSIGFSPQAEESARALQVAFAAADLDAALFRNEDFIVLVGPKR